MELTTVYFDKPGKENTEVVLNIAKRRAQELDIKTIVVASTSGDTAVKAMKTFNDFRVVIVTESTGVGEPNVQGFTKENRQIVESKGGTILTATHTFTGVSRAIRNKFNTVAIGDIISNTLYIFGQGVKVTCEIAMMAADAGLVRTDEDIIAIAGTSTGADTAIVLRPVNCHHFFDLKVKELLCKPRC